MGVGPGMFDGLGKFLAFCFVIGIIFIPLGIWKFIEIIIWLFKHITIT